MTNSKKWQSINLYGPLAEEIKTMIQNEEILFSNINQFINAVVVAEVNKIKATLNPTP